MLSSKTSRQLFQQGQRPGVGRFVLGVAVGGTVRGIVGVAVGLFVGVAVGVLVESQGMLVGPVAVKNCSRMRLQEFLALALASSLLQPCALQ